MSARNAIRALRALRRVAAKEQRGEPIVPADVVRACPYRTLLSRSWPVPHDATRAELTEALMQNVGAVLALIEPDGTASPIDAATMADIQHDLAAGRTLLLMASHPAVRDHARQQIMAWAMPAEGAA